MKTEMILIEGRRDGWPLLASHFSPSNQLACITQGDTLINSSDRTGPACITGTMHAYVAPPTANGWCSTSVHVPYLCILLTRLGMIEGFALLLCFGWSYQSLENFFRYGQSIGILSNLALGDQFLSFLIRLADFHRLAEATEGRFGQWFQEYIASCIRLHKMLYELSDNSCGQALAIWLTDNDVRQMELQYQIFSGEQVPDLMERETSLNFISSMAWKILVALLGKQRSSLS